LASTSHVYGKGRPHPGREDDAVDPPQAYPASKVAAEKALRESGLNWSILRFPFVYGDGDGHLEALPQHLAAGDWHPARRLSTIHHRDLAAAMQMALDGRMDGRIVNVADDAPASVYELASLVGQPMQGSSAPLENPWHLHVDASLARSLGFQATVRTVFQAVREKLL
jgi:UDP-glucose 4-epimerase